MSLYLYYSNTEEPRVPLRHWPRVPGCQRCLHGQTMSMSNDIFWQKWCLWLVLTSLPLSFILRIWKLCCHVSTLYWSGSTLLLSQYNCFLLHRPVRLYWPTLCTIVKPVQVYWLVQFTTVKLVQLYWLAQYTMAKPIRCTDRSHLTISKPVQLLFLQYKIEWCTWQCYEDSTTLHAWHTMMDALRPTPNVNKDSVCVHLLTLDVTMSVVSVSGNTKCSQFRLRIVTLKCFVFTTHGTHPSIQIFRRWNDWICFSVM